MNSGQAKYKNITLTHNLQQQAYEANSLHIVTSPESQTAVSNSQSRKPNNNFCNNWPQIAKTWLITDSFLIFVPTSNLGPTRQSQIWILTNHIEHLTSS